MPCCFTALTRTQDTFRAEWAWQILLAPERIPGMVQSMLQDYVEVRFSFLVGSCCIHGVYRVAGYLCGRTLSVRNCR